MRFEPWKKIRASRIPLFSIAGIQVNLDYSWFVIIRAGHMEPFRGIFPASFRRYECNGALDGGCGDIDSLFPLDRTARNSSFAGGAQVGISIKAITLFYFAARSHLASEPKTPRIEFGIAAAGPAASIALGIILHAIRLKMPHDLPSPAPAVLYFLGWINISIGIFNLVPAFPLDGGRILRSIVWWRTGSPGYAIKLSTDMGKGFSLALMALGIIYLFTRSPVEGSWLILIGFFLRSMAYSAMEGFSI